MKNATSGNAAAAIDDNPETSWFAKAEAPQSFVVDMGKPYQVSSFSYLPRQDGKTSGMTDKYQFEVSPDGKTWTKAAEGEFSNLRANPIEQSVNLRTSRNPYATSASPARTRWTATALLLRKSTSSARPQANKIHSLSCMKAFRLFQAGTPFS